MPFEQKTPRPFTPAGVKMYAPPAAGVYGISNSREWIYIGETSNILAALMEHLVNSKVPLMTHNPTGFVYELCEGEQRPSRQVRLVSEYGPACNRQTSRYQ
jgi:hypothetical protein